MDFIKSLKPESGKNLRPDVDEQMAIGFVCRLYGMDVIEIKKMISFDDQNFHIQVAQQHRNPHLSETSVHGYTLKVTNMRKSTSEEYFDAMHKALIHLNHKEVRAPLPVRYLDGRTWILVDISKRDAGTLWHPEEKGSGPHLCGVHLLTFVPGVPVSTVPYTADVLYDWGLLLAKFHNAIEDFSYPDKRTRSVSWNLEHIQDIRQFMRDLESSKEKLITSVLNRYSSEIAKYMEDLPKGFLHGDFNENNVLAQLNSTEMDKNIYSVDGVLDLEDLHYGTYGWDIGVMLAYTLLDCKTMDPLLGAGHALAGYLQLRSLSDLELTLLKICMESRLCQSLVLSAHSSRSDPNNDYLLSSEEAKWLRLKQLCNISNTDLLKTWNKIHQSYHSEKILNYDNTIASEHH